MHDFDLRILEAYVFCRRYRRTLVVVFRFRLKTHLLISYFIPYRSLHSSQANNDPWTLQSYDIYLHIIANNRTSKTHLA